MTFPYFRRRLQRGPAINAWLLSTLLLLCGLSANVYVMMQTVSWVQARSHVAVDGTLLVVDTYGHVKSRRRNGSWRLTVDYRYEFNGHRYTGSMVGLKHGMNTIDGETAHKTLDKLRSAMDGDRRVRVWVNPARPKHSRLDRTLDWNVSLGVTLLGFIAMFCGVVIGTQQSNLAGGTVIDAKTRPWRPLTFLALACNLSSWPLVVIALCELPQSASFLVAALIYAAVGVALGFAAASELLAEQRVGAPYLQYFQQGPTTIRLRFHYRPAPGKLCSSAKFSGAVSVEVRQIFHDVTKNQFSDSASMPWRVLAGQGILARGTRFFDVVVDLPQWPAAPAGVEPAYWEIVLDALDTETHFWLTPQL